MIKAVVFDVGGVLVSSPFSRILEFEQKNNLDEGVFCCVCFSFQIKCLIKDFLLA
jgi:hypothetical protein